MSVIKHAQHQSLGSGSLKWNAAITISTCAFPALPIQNVCPEKGLLYILAHCDNCHGKLGMNRMCYVNNNSCSVPLAAWLLKALFPRLPTADIHSSFEKGVLYIIYHMIIHMHWTCGCRCKQEGDCILRYSKYYELFCVWKNAQD